MNVPSPKFARPIPHTVARIIESSTPLGQELTLEQRRTFQQSGTIHFPGFITKETVAALWKAVETVQSKWVG